MSAPLDELYFTWLCDQVGSVESRSPSQSYWRMLKQLYTKEFVWVVGNDGNRASDGKDLRHEFIDQEGVRRVDRNWMRLGCSMLELFVSLSRWLAFEAGGEAHIWFWTLIENVGLEKYNDAARGSHDEIDEILERIIFRTYDRTGRGGLFPMLRSQKDQREIELWYQLNEYLIERL